MTPDASAPARRRGAVARVALAALLALAGLAAPLAAQGKGDPVHVQATGPAEPVPAGSTFAVTLQVTVDMGWHVYAHDGAGSGIPVAVTSEGGDGITWQSAEYPAASRTVFEPILDETYKVLEGSFAIRAFFRAEPSRAPGPAHATGRLDYQACTDRSCLNAAAQSFDVAITVAAAGPGAPATVPAASAGAGTGSSASPGAATNTGSGTDTAGTPSPVTPAPATTLESDFARALAAGDVGGVIWLSVVLAFISLLTPCVFPMIPITVSFFTKRGTEEGRGQGTKYALAYGLGIVATYTGFGIGMALLLGASSLQSFAANPVTNVAIGALFVFFGLSLMGFYDLRPPAFLARRAESGVAAGARGYVPVIAMGFVFTVTAFTCTAPIIGSLLAKITSSGSPGLIVIGMLSYSAAFALPFVLLAMFPGMVGRLPGAGGWMITLKAALGFIELIAALKFFSNADLAWDLQLLSRPVVLMLGALLSAALALYLFGTYRLPHDVPGRRRALSLRTLAALVTVLFCLYLASGVPGRELDAWTDAYLPRSDYAAGPAPGGRSAAGIDGVNWVEDFESARARADSERRNLFIDFTGITCVNCRIVEKSVFGRPDFPPLMERVVPTRLFTDRKGSRAAGDTANQRLMESLGSVTLPLYVLMSPDGEVLKSMGYRPGLSVADFATFVESTP